MTGSWTVYDLDENVLHDINPSTDDEWTGPDALRQAIFAAADGGTVIALLVVGDLAFFVHHGTLRVCPLRTDGVPALEHAMPVERDQAGIGWIVEQFQV